MKFRPCIDIHNGKVKQLIGGTLKDEGDFARENFVAGRDAASYARLFEKDGLTGGHIILLNRKDSPYYEATKKEAVSALKSSPGRWQAGGGIDAENANEFLLAGASHMIVTSVLFKEGKLDMTGLEQLVKAAGREKIVIDLSCRRRNNQYIVVTDRWQTFTDVTLGEETLDFLSDYCDEFLIHGVDAEGKKSGIEEELAVLLSDWLNSRNNKRPVTYAGGISSFEDINKLSLLSGGALDFTVGSALDLYGGNLPYKEIVHRYA